MKEKYIKPVANIEGEGKNFFPAVEAFVAGAAAAKTVKSVLGVRENAQRYVVLQDCEKKAVLV